MQVVSNSQTAQPRWRRPGFLNQRHDNPPSRGTDIHLHSATALIRCEREPRIRLTEQSRHAPMATHPRTDLTQAPCTEGVSRHVAAIGAIATNALARLVALRRHRGDTADAHICKPCAPTTPRSNRRLRGSPFRRLAALVLEQRFFVLCVNQNRRTSVLAHGERRRKKIGEETAASATPAPAFLIQPNGERAQWERTAYWERTAPLAVREQQM